MRLGWRCIDCNKDGVFLIPDTGALGLEDIYAEIMNQHAAVNLKPGEIYFKGVSQVHHPLAAAVLISFMAPSDGRIQSKLGKLIMITEPRAGWPNFEVRHVR